MTKRLIPHKKLGGNIFKGQTDWDTNLIIIDGLPAHYIEDVGWVRGGSMLPDVEVSARSLKPHLVEDMYDNKFVPVNMHNLNYIDPDYEVYEPNGYYYSLPQIERVILVADPEAYNKYGDSYVREYPEDWVMKSTVTYPHKAPIDYYSFGNEYHPYIPDLLYSEWRTSPHHYMAKAEPTYNNPKAKERYLLLANETTVKQKKIKKDKKGDIMDKSAQAIGNWYKKHNLFGEGWSTDPGMVI